jgi:hypothetical protein
MMGGADAFLPGGDSMKRILKSSLLIAAMFLLASRPGAGAAEKDELLYKVCFPKGEATAKKDEASKGGARGLKDDAKEQPAPTVEKGQNYTFLGATDYGVLWGASNYRVIGDDRVRFLLFVVPTASTKVTYYDRDYSLVPYNMIQTAFFSSFGEYKGSSVSVSYKVTKKVERKEEVNDSSGVLQMVDLHCSAKEMKIYDNHTLYYRMAEPQSKESLCVELLWEKPEAPLPWQPVSSLTTDILTGFYCKGKK